MNCDKDLIYSIFFNKIQIHLINRLEFLLEYKICNSINRNYLFKRSPQLKSNDWMQKIIDDVFESILKSKNKSSQQSKLMSFLEQIFIRKFNLFISRIYELTITRDKRSIDDLREGLKFYMNWITVNYDQHLKADNFPNFLLELIEQNLHFETLSSTNLLIDNRRSSINRNQIAPQQTSIYETKNLVAKKLDDTDYGDYGFYGDSLRGLQFKSDARKRFKFPNKNSYFKMFFCFNTV